MATNSYFTLSHASLHNGEPRRFVSLLNESLLSGVETPRAVEFSVNGFPLLTIGTTGARPAHSLNLLIRSQAVLQAEGFADYEDYGTYEDLVTYHGFGSATFWHWDGVTTGTMIFTLPRLEPIWLTPDGSVIVVRFDMLQQ